MRASGKRVWFVVLGAMLVGPGICVVRIVRFLAHEPNKTAGEPAFSKDRFQDRLLVWAQRRVCTTFTQDDVHRDDGPRAADLTRQ